MPKIKLKHKKLQNWINEMTEMCRPEKIVVVSGDQQQKKELEKEAFSTGELIKLNQSKLPGCVYHRTAVNDVARTEGLTFICARKKKDVGPTNNWMSPKSTYKKAAKIFKNSMKGRIMYIIPFSMGPVGSPFSKVGVELTDSIYVVLNMLIMTRVGSEVLAYLGRDGKFTKCLHGKADRDINRRLILHFPEDNAIWSVGSGYGGNVLLGKKCLSLRIASFLAKKEGWLAEHMLILGVELPDGRIKYLTGAFPSACGKTNLAMLVPPKALKKKGYKIWTVGDDIAWMRVDSDGALWAINPETGFFGVLPGTNPHTNPNAMEAIKKNTIYTNVLLKPDLTVWWEDGDGPPPARGTDWTGKPWQPGRVDEEGKPIKGAQPNSRFTAPIAQCPSASFRSEHHHGVPISAIILGGRRASLAPLVYESFNWQHGVYLGATMASERTAAQYGKQGEVRRDPIAMLPFCGYNMANYFRHWLSMGKKMVKPPRIFFVNWFRKDKHGKFIWPGFSENLRILNWILERSEGRVGAIKTPLGYIPRYEDIDMTGLNFSRKRWDELFYISKKAWQNELKDLKKFLNKFGKILPKEVIEEYKAFDKRLKKYRENR
ncbi:MAG: phosphoenolpyruvate carboxykinase (GTP) [Candidatus Omnitrophica bacterium]|nr:phosphoenolpyruvate carboxykinase (GTP) [Candidatus Omnitrophota bacterium]